ncbi:MAG: zinc ribbon domain-containing protein, partial [Coleofasciculus sp.]
KYGCVVVDVTEEYTSKTCSKCGHIHTKLGGNKHFVCPSCGHAIGRDINGAFNILLKDLERYLRIWHDRLIPDCAVLRNFQQ